MTAKLQLLLRLHLTRPFALAYLTTGDHTPILAACDLLEEQDDTTYYQFARAVRAALLGGF